MKSQGQVVASRKEISDDFVIGAESMIRADSVLIEEHVVIGSHVKIVCDHLVLKKGTTLNSHITMICPDIRIGERCSVADHLEVEMNEFFRLGNDSAIGKNVAFSGQGFQSGEFLWMKDHVIVGGGGSKGPHSYLTIGNQTSIFDQCFINLSESVEIGSGSALSKSVSLLTHAAWQPALMGFPTTFAPIKIGDNSVVYLNSSVMPGVMIGNYSTVGANSLVTQMVPDHCLAAGVPAKIKKGPKNYPTPLSIDQTISFLTQLLADYATTLPGKGVCVESDSGGKEDQLQLVFNGKKVKMAIVSAGAQPERERPDITISVETVPPEHCGLGHFDLGKLQFSGDVSKLSEDFRDYLRRRAIRVVTGKPFRTLPLVNLDRLKRQMKHIIHE